MQEEFSRVSPSQDHERGSDGARLKLAILDDYQGVALAMADWSALESRIDITVFRDTVEDQATLAQRLAPFSVACLMRGRTPMRSEESGVGKGGCGKCRHRWVRYDYKKEAT